MKGLEKKKEFDQLSLGSSDIIREYLLGVLILYLQHIYFTIIMFKVIQICIHSTESAI